MPQIKLNDQTIDCEPGDNLRKALLKAGLTPHNPAAHYLNCRGFGTCGTCAVRVDGEVSPETTIERWRLNFPPHRLEQGLRLACQCQVLGDLELTKGAGFWGQDIDESI